MSNYYSATLDSTKEFLNGINHTVWGLLIIFICILLKIKGVASETVYYFAGIGSTMIGIKSPGATVNNNSVVNSEVK
jgi:hypothetical protein